MAAHRCEYLNYEWMVGNHVEYRGLVVILKKCCSADLTKLFAATLEFLGHDTQDFVVNVALCLCLRPCAK